MRGPGLLCSGEGVGFQLKVKRGEGMRLRRKCEIIALKVCVSSQENAGSSYQPT